MIIILLLFQISFSKGSSSCEARSVMFQDETKLKVKAFLGQLHVVQLKSAEHTQKYI